jgi:hypothetical protein
LGSDADMEFSIKLESIHALRSGSFCPVFRSQFHDAHYQFFMLRPATHAHDGAFPPINAEMNMSKSRQICAAIAAIAITSIGSLSPVSAQSVPYRHHTGHGYVFRAWPPGEGNSQYPDYSHTGSGYSRTGCSASPAEC